MVDCKDYYCNISPEAKWLSYKGWVAEGLFFAYRRQITVTEQSGDDLADYQVLIELDSDNFDFSHANNDGSDIRFYDGNNFLDYWIEKWDSVNQEAKIWVKVPFISADSSTSFYMCYGNPNIANASNGETTFDFFKDFKNCGEGSLSGEGYLCNDLIHCYGDILHKITVDENGNKIYRQEDNSTSLSGVANVNIPSYTQFKLIVRGRTSDNFYAGWGVSSADAEVPNCRHEFYVGLNTSEKAIDKMMLQIKDASGTAYQFDLEDYDQDNYHTYIMGVTSDDVKVWADGNYLGHSGISYITDCPANYIHIRTGKTQTGTHDTDWLAIAKYTDPEPSVSIGEEETP